MPEIRDRQSSQGMVWKMPISPFRRRWRHAVNEIQSMETLMTEQQAMDTLKNKVSQLENSTTNIMAILINSFKSYGADPSPSAYSFVIKYLIHKRLFSHLPLVLDHLEKAEQIEVPERIFIYLIQTYGKAELLQDAANIFYRIPNFRCTPSVRSLNSLLSVLCKKKEGLLLVQDVLIKSLELKIRLEASSFRILIRALCRNGKVRSAREIFNMMLQLDECIPLDAKIYSLLLHSLCERSEVAEVMGFLKEMRNSGFLPEVSDYNNVIDIFVRDGKAKDAYAILNRMKMDGRRPDIKSYNSVLCGFLIANDFLKVDQLFDEILLVGLVPDILTYNTYIGGLCERGNFERACRMVICMEKTGCRLESSTFNVLIAGYSKAGEIRRARKLMNEMLEKGFPWNLHTYESMITGLIQKGEILEGHNLLMEMLAKGYAPQLSTCSSLICSLCKKDHCYEALQVFDEMTNQSIWPDAMLWEALLGGCGLNQQASSTNLASITLTSLAP